MLKRILINYTDFGGEGAIVHFAHANAYTPRTYTHFLTRLNANYKVIAMDQRPIWPDRNPADFNNWKVLGDDLLQFVEEQDIEEIILVGHSMGGIASLIAAQRKPDLISKVILIEPVILPEDLIQTMGTLKTEDRLRNNPMFQIASKRRNEWGSYQEAEEYFNSKRFFKKFSSHAKKDFLSHGIVQIGDTYHLKYEREWEAQIYGTVANAWPYLRKNQTPMLIIKAEHSDVITAETWSKIIEETPNSTCYEMPTVGHLIPQEMPDLLASLVFDYLED